MKLKKIPIFVLSLLVLFLVSCIRDTDFDQASDITATPIVELDLIYFTLDASDFFDSITNTPRLTLRDTTRIDFLDETDFQESLLRAEFLFEFTNSIPRQFDVDFQFLSVANDTTYTTSTSVLAGTEQNPVETTFIENVERPEVFDLTSAEKVVVSVTIPSSSEALEGELNLKSKATYYLEITERE
jgi:hypothetical protein